MYFNKLIASLFDSACEENMEVGTASLVESIDT